MKLEWLKNVGIDIEKCFVLLINGLNEKYKLHCDWSEEDSFVLRRQWRGEIFFDGDPSEESF